MNPIRKKQFIRLSVYLFLAGLVLWYIWLCQTGQGLSCYFYDHYHIQCPSCGASRAFLSLLRLDFIEAGRQNAPFAFAIYPIFLLIAGQDFILCLSNLCRRKNRISFLRFLFGERDTEQECSPFI